MTEMSSFKLRTSLQQLTVFMNVLLEKVNAVELIKTVENFVEMHCYFRET